MWHDLFTVLSFQSGYNTTLVTLGALTLGASAGATGVFLFLRKRALVSDAIAHATLPGIGIAFLVMVALGGTGRALPGLLIGSAISAGTGLYLISLMSRHTRLSEDVAIGVILSVFFGAGIVFLTYIQSLSIGQQAGLEGFLLGSTAGMLFSEALILAIGGLISFALIILYRKPFTLVSFDQDYARSIGLNIPFYDMLIMLLAMGVTVIGLKIVGLILIVALLIIPAVTARLWYERIPHILIAAACLGGFSSYLGAAISAVFNDLPTGPVIVLVSFSIFIFSLLFAPLRGVVAHTIRHYRFQQKVHRRQGLLSLARGEKIYDRLTLKILMKEGFIREDGVATQIGHSAAAKALLDEHRWAIYRNIYQDITTVHSLSELDDISTILTTDQLIEVDRHLKIESKSA